MQIVQHVAELQGDCQRFAQWQTGYSRQRADTVLLKIVIQRRAIDVGHDQVPAFGIAEPVEDARQERMAQCRENFCLAVKGVGGLDDFL